MARILSISSSEVLRTTRQLVLEREGYQVHSLPGAQDVGTLPKDEKFDVAVIGHTFEGHDKRKIANLINQRFPGLPILELCFHSPDIPGADFILTDSPVELLAAVKEILAGRRVRGFPSQ
jgi:DNA-binding NtrC family response regulator